MLLEIEVVVNGPKTWSLAAALDSEVAEAYDAAQDRTAGEIIGWLAQHATTRVGSRGRQVQVPVERIEAATVRHYTSRAGDPHRDLHVQINARVWAEGKWRGLHIVGVRDMIDAINGIGHAAVMCDPQFRQVLANRGFTIDAESGEVNELAGFVGAFSARARQIGKNIERYEATWRDTHPGQEPGPELLRTWDRRAWSQARPDKVVPTDGTVLTDRWVDELHRLGFRSPTHRTALSAARSGALDRDAAVTTVLSRLGAKRSGWNAADIRGQVELLIASEGIIADPAVRIGLAEDLTARAVAVCVPLLAQDGTPEHIRALTSREVLGVEADPSEGITLPRRRKADAAMRIPTVEEVGQLLAHSDSTRVSTRKGFRAYVALCAFAGLRLGEAAGVQVGDIYLADELVIILSEHVAAHVGDGGPDRWLFTVGADPMYDNAITWRWRATRRAAGLPKARLHDLRH